MVIFWDNWHKQDWRPKKLLPSEAEFWVGMGPWPSAPQQTQSESGEVTRITVPGGQMWGTSSEAPSVECAKQGLLILSTMHSSMACLAKTPWRTMSCSLTAHYPNLALPLGHKEAKATLEEEDILNRKRLKKWRRNRMKDQRMLKQYLLEKFQPGRLLPCIPRRPGQPGGRWPCAGGEEAGVLT